MTTANQEITDLKGEFEGGKSFSIDWYAKLRLGARAMLDQINPDTLKREVPIYGGLTRGLHVYYCPDDVEVPARLYDTRDRRVFFEFVPSRYFYDHPDRRDVFTIEYVNGARFIVLRHPMNAVSATIDTMDDATETFGGDVTLSKNTYNVLPGSNASLEGTFSDTEFTVNRDISSSPLNISNLLRGVAIVPLNIDSALNLSTVKLLLKTDDENYYEVQSTQDSIGDYFRDGQNMVRFWLNNATIVGAPDPTNIAKWELQIQMKAGTSQTVVIGKMTVQQSHLYVFEYQSNRMFIDKTTGAWKDTPSSGDTINLERSALGILHFETCRIVIQSAKTELVNAPESQRMDTNLTRAYNSYYMLHPSAAEPLSYDISPEIALNPDPFFEYGFGGLPDRIGSFSNAIQPEYAVNFADDEVPSPAIDGTTTVFTLLHVPNPASSVVVTINGQILTLGQDFTLAANQITLLEPYFTAPFVGLPFTVSYRYSV